ncbi:MAG: DUF6763 family protein [Desulfurivibrio sp.]|nr:DUF6763 family protein [Desulfurivibrio sp.]
MSSNTDGPVEGNWYELPAGEVFTVVTVDEDEGIVEVQYEDASLEEIELANWDDLGADPIEPPDEWGGNLSDFDDDLEYDIDPEEIEEE